MSCNVGGMTALVCIELVLWQAARIFSSQRVDIKFSIWRRVVQWEYRTEKSEPSGLSDLDLNIIGANGYELVGVVANSGGDNGLTYFFKKPMSEEMLAALNLRMSN